MSSKNKSNEFYSHCVACDMRLNPKYTFEGLCGDCLRVKVRCMDQENVDMDNRYVRDEMWRNYLGSVEDEIFLELSSEDDDYE